MSCANCGDETTEDNDLCVPCQQKQLPDLDSMPAIPVMATGDPVAAHQAGAYIAPVAVKGVSFPDAIKSGLTQYVGFSGRARRSEYWWFTVFYSIVALVVGISAISIAVATGAPAAGATADQSAVAMGGAVSIAVAITDLVLLTLFLPTLALIIRRLHDTNRSGWFYLLTLIPLAGSIVLLVFKCEDSNRGPNSYGLSPKYV